MGDALVYRDPEGAPEIVWATPSLDPVPRAEPPDVSRLPGAKVVADFAYGDANGTEMRVGCARGPSSRFAKGIEDALLDRATAFVLKTGKLTADEIAITGSSGDIDAGLVERHVEGKSGDRSFAMHHVLTFAGADRDVLLCSALCVGHEARSQCDQATRSLRVSGTHALPPPPSLLTHAVFFAAAHPLVALSALTLAFVAVSAVLIARRPRGRYR